MFFTLNVRVQNTIYVYLEVGQPCYNLLVNLSPLVLLKILIFFFFCEINGYDRRTSCQTMVLIMPFVILPQILCLMWSFSKFVCAQAIWRFKHCWKPFRKFCSVFVIYKTKQKLHFFKITFHKFQSRQVEHRHTRTHVHTFT